MIGATRRKSTARAWKTSAESDENGRDMHDHGSDADHDGLVDVDFEEHPHEKSRASLLAVYARRNPSTSLVSFVVALSLLLLAGHVTITGAGRRRRSSVDEVRPPPGGGGGAPVRSSPVRPQFACNCSSRAENDEDKCCKRLVLRAHKMGVYLVQMYFRGIPTEIIHPDRLREHRRDSGAASATTASADYRHVVLTRPWYDAIVSGYLYHKSGRECWLDAYGRRRAINKTLDWERSLALPLDPPSRGRSLCSYLSEESEEVGMRAYVDFSVSDLYSGIVPHRKLVEELETDGDRHTLFICFGDLEDETSFQATHRRAMEWLYPGRPYDEMALPYAGTTQGHGTSRDSDLRLRLRGLVETFDHRHFDGIGDMATKGFGCEGRSAPMLSNAVANS